MSDASNIVHELRGLTCVRGVHSMVSRPHPEWPEIVVELDAFDSFNLAVVTCALIRALPDVDRRHVGVMWGERMRGIVAPRSRLLPLEMGAPIAEPPRARQMHVLDERDFFILHRTALAPYADPFRAPAPPPPLLVLLGDDSMLSSLSLLIPQIVGGKSYRVVWHDEVAELEGLEDNPFRIYIDEAFAPEALAWLARRRPADLARTFVLSDERGRDWLEDFLHGLGVRGVQILTPDEIPDSLREH